MTSKRKIFHSLKSFFNEASNNYYKTLLIVCTIYSNDVKTFDKKCLIISLTSNLHFSNLQRLNESNELPDRYNWNSTQQVFITYFHRIITII